VGALINMLRSANTNRSEPPESVFAATMQMPNALTEQPHSMTFAYVTVWLFTLVYFARPGDWIALPFAQIVGVFVILAFLGSLLSGVLPALWWSWDVVLLLLLFAQICLAVPFGIWPGASFQVAEEFAKIIVITLAIIVASNSLARLRRLIYIQTAAVMIMAVLVATGYGGSLQGAAGSRTVGIVGGVFQNPNDLALAIALIFPFAFAFAVRADKLVWKLVWMVAMLVATYTCMTTYSRSGLLALLAAATISFWEFVMKGRRLSWALLVVPGVALILVASPSGLGQRMVSIFQPDADVTGSSQQRREILIRSLEVTAENPLVGVGPGNFPIVSGMWKVTHNSYTQLSAEAGLPALFLFLLLGRCSFSNLRRARQLDPNNQELVMWAGSLQASLAALAVGALFSSIAFHYFPYFLIGYTGALYRLSYSDCLARRPVSDPSFCETPQPAS